MSFGGEQVVGEEQPMEPVIQILPKCPIVQCIVIRLSPSDRNHFVAGGSQSAIAPNKSTRFIFAQGELVDVVTSPFQMRNAAQPTIDAVSATRAVSDPLPTRVSSRNAKITAERERLGLGERNV